MKRLLVVISAVTALGVAAPARADANQDQAFLVALDAAGITYQSPDSAVSAAKKVCELADGGKSGIEVVQVLQDGNPGLSQVNAARFTAIAAGVYCPAKLPAKGSE
ncbi:DUF732 domain-containing protein [Mycobacterium asiaticum]|uniref:DUF732 domain-containing protein n=1 Tax=Mycobacterium asiaticum TaxID=1790 RepID=A0A1A3N995_MYCAS|nr:DUF732 domain-containing protein [Mycobacterium asiaticum]OBK18351.1 hypothetical protein A5636_20900 [Mycobacterium asiaticum]